MHTAGRLIYSYGGTVIGIPNAVFDGVHFQTELANFLSLPGKVDWDPPNVPAGHPEYITALLTGILRSVGHIVEGHRVLKHVRDDAVLEWRRSSLWLLIRVAIQTSLDHSPFGQASFKSFMLFLICNLAMDAHDADFSSNMLYLMSAKILRRLSKLGSSVPGWLSEMPLRTCTCLQDTLDSRATQIRAAKSPSPHWNPSELDLAGDIQLSLLHCGEYIRDSVANRDHTYVVAPFHPKHYHRSTLGDYLSSDTTLFDRACDADPSIALYDVEKSVEQGIDDWLVGVTNVDEACSQLETLMDKYLSISSDVYSDGSEKYSIVALTTFELWVALDKLVVEEIPMLAEYSPEILIPSLEFFRLRETTNLHRLSSVSQYLLARHSRSRPGLLLPSNRFDDDSFPVRYCDSSPDLQQLKSCVEEAMGREGGELCERRTACRALAKVVAFELQCPAPFRIWRSAVGHLLQRVRLEEHLSQFSPRVHEHSEKQPHDLLSDIPELQPFLANDPCEESHTFQLAYFYPDRESERHGFHYVYRVDKASYFPRLERVPRCAPFFTFNDVLSSQADCPENSSLDEYIAVEHLRRAGSLRWVDILRELRSRTLDFHSPGVYDSLADLTCRAGPLDHKTGEWVWHQELRDPVFCNMLLNELEHLFADVRDASLDGTPMCIISLLLTRLLASNPPECVVERGLQLLRNIRRKTLEWVRELAYNLIQAPTSNERRRCLRNMTLACSSTFRVGASSFRKVLHSVEDVEASLSCALFTIATEGIPDRPDDYTQMLCRLSVAIDGKEVVKDAVLSDASDRGIDLAVHNVWPGYQPGPGRWQQEQHPHSHWLVSTTAETAGRQSRIVRINLLDGSFLVDGRPLGILPEEILGHPLYKRVFSYVCTDQDARRRENIDFFHSGLVLSFHLMSLEWTSHPRT